MSTSPHWIPVTPIKKHSLPKAIKYPLARKYFDHDGTLTGQIILDIYNIAYLEGLRDSGKEGIKEGAQKLIDAIQKYRQIYFILE